MAVSAFPKVKALMEGFAGAPIKFNHIRPAKADKPRKKRGKYRKRH